MTWGRQNDYETALDNVKRELEQARRYIKALEEVNQRQAARLGQIKEPEPEHLVIHTPNREVKITRLPTGWVNLDIQTKAAENYRQLGANLSKEGWGCLLSFLRDTERIQR